jgi:hypothetical protein
VRQLGHLCFGMGGPFFFHRQAREGDGMNKWAVRERLQIMRLFQRGFNTAQIGALINLPEPDVERIIHTRTCLDMKREVRMLRSLSDCAA